MAFSLRWGVLAVSLCVHAVLATTVAEIQGSAFQSPLKGKKVTDVTGIVTATTSDGFWIAGEAVEDVRVSTGLFVYTGSSSSYLTKVASGDSVSLSGTVTEYRSSDEPNDLYVTELEDVSHVSVVSSNNKLTPIVLGKDRSPPTQLFSALDTGPAGFLSLPGNTSQIETVNASLQPATYGVDFWESLEGQLVQVSSPVAIDYQDDYGDIWVYGAWDVTGKNSRGGLTIAIGPDGLPDGNPETILIGSPLDGTTNPNVSIGTTLSDVTGVITFEYGFHYLLPLTAPKITSSPRTAAPVTNLTSSTDACVITLGDYNIDNMAPNAPHMAPVAAHIANNLLLPDLVFLQEVQDDSGPTDDGTVSANQTLTNIVTAIKAAAGAGADWTYAFADVDPQNDQDGGETGGNIRQAYLWNANKIQLVPGSPAGGATDAVKATRDSSGQITLNYNPGRIDPTSPAWSDSRKPLVAAWETVGGGGQRFFTINLQLVAKLDSSTTEGDARPPVNAWVSQRQEQANVTAAFVESVLALNASTSLILGGDFNEFSQTTQVLAPITALLTEADVLASIPPVERYTYVYYQNSEQLDHVFVSKGIEGRGVEAQHVHVNSWAESLAVRASDHDPTVVRLRVC